MFLRRHNDCWQARDASFEAYQDRPKFVFVENTLQKTFYSCFTGKVNRENNLLCSERVEFSSKIS